MAITATQVDPANVGAVSAEVAAGIIRQRDDYDGKIGLALYTFSGQVVTDLNAMDTAAITKRSVAVAYTDLAAGNTNGASVAINIGAALPANARILSANIRLATPFTGGSASAVTVDIGTTGDPNAIVAAADVLSAAVDGQASSMPFGIAPFKFFSSAGAQLKATFTPDGGHQLANLTAGSCTIEVLFAAVA